ncbi:MAG: NAD(P)-dependent oxidoreductase, partial [Erysipelotrichaceae bacterium]|nr:NAD(P)-dependent oxidoreductase [Erysipelotrichaceae bacterium]
MKGIMLVSDDQELIVAKKIVDEKKVNIKVKLDKIANITEEELSEYQAILGYSNNINRDLLARFAKHGIKYYVTRSTGYNHIDLKAAKEFGIRIANVPAYSPNAIAELALALALDLNRKVSEQANDIANKRFTRPEKLFKEIRDCTVGILGLGSIGSTSAHYFNALGAKVIGYNRSINPDNEKILTYMDVDKVIKQSDILLIHLPYIQDENYHMINKELLKDAKKELIIINTARGELVNLRDIVELIEKE